MISSLLNPKTDKIYLDVGCGTGNLAIKIHQTGARVIGIDYSIEMLDRARRKDENIRFEFADINKKLNFEDSFFDGVITNNVISYIENPNNMIREIYRVLKPKGKFIAATLRNNFSPYAVYKEHLKHVGLLHAFRIFFPLIGLGIHNMIILKKIKQNIYHTYDEKTFLNLIEQSGFTNIKILFSYANQDLVAVSEKE